MHRAVDVDWTTAGRVFVVLTGARRALGTARDDAA